MKELTKEDFEIFIYECNRWIEFFGLYGWNVFYYFEELDEYCFANCTCDLGGRVCAIRLNTKFPEQDYSVINLKKTAFHEVCEMLFSRIVTINNARYVGSDEIGEEVHNLIRIFENKLFPLMKVST